MKILFLYLLLVVISAGSVFCQDIESEGKVRNYLVTHFPKKDTLFVKTLIYDNFELESIATPVLTKKAALKVFKTKLITGYYEYQVLDIAVILTSDNKIEILKSPTFTGPDENFLNLFNAICVDKVDEKIEITKEISNIFKEITLDGSILNIQVTDKGTSSDLNHGRLHWRQLNFDFDQNCLISVDLLSAKK